MRKVKRREEQETGSCSLEKLTGANGPQTEKVQDGNNMCNKVKSSGSAGSLEEDDPLPEENTLEGVLGTGF